MNVARSAHSFSFNCDAIHGSSHAQASGFVGA
jgi:hypothetical protein